MCCRPPLAQGWAPPAGGQALQLPPLLLLRQRAVARWAAARRGWQSPAAAPARQAAAGWGPGGGRPAAAGWRPSGTAGRIAPPAAARSPLLPQAAQAGVGWRAQNRASALEVPTGQQTTRAAIQHSHNQTSQAPRIESAAGPDAAAKLAPARPGRRLLHFLALASVLAALLQQLRWVSTWVRHHQLGQPAQMQRKTARPLAARSAAALQWRGAVPNGAPQPTGTA